MKKIRGRTSKIPKPCPVCGKNNWGVAKFQRLNDKKRGEVIVVLSWRCPCGYERDTKDNRGKPPEPWELKKLGIKNPKEYKRPK